MFQSSPVSNRLLRYFNHKFLPRIAPIALLKCCAVVSCKLDRPRLSVLDVAPPRTFKSYTSTEVMWIFEQADFWIDLHSDFTMNSLKRYASDLEEGRCLLVNDGTTLMASKAQRTKNRLAGGLSELLADETYEYQDFGEKFALKGRVTMIMNLTSEAHLNYKDRLFGLTFSERFLTVHHILTRKEKDEWVSKMEASKRIHFDDPVSVDDIETDPQIPKKYLGAIGHLAQDFSYEAMKTEVGCQDIIKATMIAHASLNKRKEVGPDDLAFLHIIRQYLKDPFSPYEGRILRYRAEGLSFREICRKMGKSTNYIRQVQRVVEKARMRGILDSQSPEDRMTPRKAGDTYG